MALEDLPEEIFNSDHGLSKYTSEQKMNTVVGFITLGKIGKAAKFAGVPASTARKWKQTAPWWDPVLKELKQSDFQAKVGKMNEVVNKALDELEDRVVQGDVQLVQGFKEIEYDDYDPETGEVTRKTKMVKGMVETRKKMSGRDLATVVTTIQDRATMLENVKKADDSQAAWEAKMEEVANMLAKAMENTEVQGKVVGQMLEDQMKDLETLEVVEDGSVE